MNPSEIKLRQREIPDLDLDRRARLRCAAASELVEAGRCEEAREALGELWRGVGERPETQGLSILTTAEVLLQCGVLTGWLGSARQASDAQERAKDLLFESLRAFEAAGLAEKVAEAQCELGLCYFRLGAYDEGRVILETALDGLGPEAAGLRARIAVRRASVEIWEGRYYEARRVLEEARPALDAAGDALRGKWHGQMGLVFRRLASAEARPEYYDSAIIEFTAAIYHHELAGHERYVAGNTNNLAMVLYNLGRYAEAHEHLDRAQAILTRLNDAGQLAYVDETRASVLVAEKRYAEADRFIGGVVRYLEPGGESALLAEALTIQGVVRARLGDYENSVAILRRAMKVAQESGAQTLAAQAALALIEEHGASTRLPAEELSKIYRRADELLKGTQDAEDIARLRASARAVIKRLARAELHERDFTFYSAVHELEARLIEQALELEDGSLTRAAKRLGLKHQSLAHMLRARHAQLLDKRTPPIPRRRSIIRQRKNSPRKGE
ncbi:MAG TPA: helix-turn-helix domain-containing protein [Pyrinomonadaceae bacterium]|nr:helix-turn-helix domain-containing protein [Pyrinomonadaceae bacterium]